MENIQFSTQVVMGEDALQILERVKEKRVLIVADPFVTNNGMLEQVTTHLKSYHLFSDIVPDPPLDKIVSGIKEMENFQSEVIVAVGGGSAIDAAKAMKYFGQKIMKRLTECFIAIPTTSGTGSEVTNFSVITLSELGLKVPLVTDEIQPDIAILDVSLVMSVPPKVTADTGMDVLTHAIEAYVSTKANKIADALCEKVVVLVFHYLERAFKNGQDEEARKHMHLASCMAGMAFNLTSLGLNHGIAHAAGARLHVSHGRINAILLPEVIAYNSGLADGQVMESTAAKRYMALANCISSPTNHPRIGVQKLIRLIKQLREKLAIPATLTEYGISASEVAAKEKEIVHSALADSCTKTNPRKADEKAVATILKAVL
ncbi:1-propanol dehydrogenase PduQ [Enterococcus ratti]|uniref:1-propanol dehydrogenase PduQ n=1 Tax=Enterococcus ratti TaxID=150033 RepID=UPI0035187B40